MVDGFDLPLDDPMYEGLGAKMTFEVRDFSSTNRQLVVHFVLGDRVYTGIGSWEKFTDGLDAMRARMLADNWDDAYAQLLGRSN